LQTRQYKLGIESAQKYIKYFDSYSINWFAFMENYFLLAIHSKDYVLALNILATAFHEQHIAKLAEYSKECWELYRRYALLASKHAGNDIFSHTILSNVTDSLAIIPKDKVGFNITIIILGLLEDFAKPGFDLSQSHIDRINSYTFKYLKGPKAERAKLFFKLMLLAINSNLDYNVIIKKDKAILESLQKLPIPGSAFAEVEIIPYEHLWEIVLNIIKSRNSNSTKSIVQSSF
ncbi:hypothetical protein, partial [Pontibacter sp. H249]|uniref:hypothetical protein n=1 Tax=Pontibacter sp. H249 TaxID=3133420 RepID=UPI0030BC9318